MIDALLARNQCRPDDLGAVAFGAGPGSFTGVRIGCGVAQGLALALNIACLGIDCLQARAEKFIGEPPAGRLGGDAQVPQALAVLIDARMGQHYMGIYPLPLAPATELIVADPAQCRDRLTQLAGDTRLWVLSEIDGFVAPGVPVYPVDGAELAVAIARRAQALLVAGERPSAAQAGPLYVRNKVALDIDEQAALRAARS